MIYRVWSMSKAMTLTAVLEDYLEAIFNLCRFNQAARSRDIAESLNVHKSTVTAALKSLGQMKLINYAPYEAVTLTAEGRRLAEDVAIRHSALRDFFVNVLKVDRDTAETAACGMEHAIPREIVEKLAAFAVSMRNCPQLVGQEAATDKKECTSCMSKAASQRSAVAVAHPSLDQVPVGMSAKVVTVNAAAGLKKRLTEMGLTRGSKVTVERVAPMGDPIDVKVRGYHLSLRKEEAASILVREE